MAEAFPDTEGAVRAYLRAHTDVSALVAQRVWFGIPDTPQWPLVTVQRIDGTTDTSDGAAFDVALIQATCWGALFNDSSPTKKPHPDKAGADAVRRAVCRAFADLIGGATVGSVHLDGGDWRAGPYLEDPDNKRPYYPVTAPIVARAA